MVIKNHIAYRFLTDEKLLWEMCEAAYPKEWKTIFNTVGPKEDDLDPHLYSFYHLISPKENKTYYITDSVSENFDLLKVDKEPSGHYKWSVFNNLPKNKYTFILSGNRALRIHQAEDIVNLFWLTFRKAPNHGPEIKGKMHWVMLYFNRKTGELCTHFDHKDALDVEELLYKLMCFFFLTENDEIEIAGGKSHGTKKSGKLLNDFKFPVIIVNSRWNTTSIRTQGFLVSGHFRLQICGVGRQEHKLIFIEPFEKHGYTRRAGKILT